MKNLIYLFLISQTAVYKVDLLSVYLFWWAFVFKIPDVSIGDKKGRNLTYLNVDLKQLRK